MTNRVALITGGMGGLGEAICTKMADAGYQVAVTYSPGKQDLGRMARGDEGARATTSRPIPATSPTSIPARRASPRSRPRSGPVDMLVNNAGITRDMTFKKMDKVDWDAVHAAPTSTACST